MIVTSNLYIILVTLLQSLQNNTKQKYKQRKITKKKTLQHELPLIPGARSGMAE
jgi:hypothetical protein